MNLLVRNAIGLDPLRDLGIVDGNGNRFQVGPTPMTLQEEVDLLRNIPLFSKIESSKLKLIAFTSERRVYPAGTVICREGDPGDAAYILIRGNADITIATPQGELKVSETRPNDIIGEIAVLCDVPRTATVTATTDLTVLVISRDLFFRLIREFPSIGLEVMRELGLKLAQTTAKLRQCMDASKDHMI